VNISKGHFSALVPSEPYQRLDAAREEEEDVTFLPLMDCENKLIPIHFLSQSEVSLNLSNKRINLHCIIN
jgi:ubiquitin thioesterase ZRANB1